MKTTRSKAPCKKHARYTTGITADFLAMMNLLVFALATVSSSHLAVIVASSGGVVFSGILHVIEHAGEA